MLGRTLSHYRIVGQLGAGGMGVVYSAEDVRLGRKVALKFVSEYLASDQQAILRLRSEARAASALNHPNICTIYDIGEDDGHPFIVMELMKGLTLRDRLASGPLKVSQVVDFGVEIADALHAAHNEGIIHRDIKPGNLFITERGHIKILDFGLAKLTSQFVTSATTDHAHTSAAGMTQGTPAYMSPEQATGDELDGRSDLFSLGVVLYECATGHHPFPGKTSAVIVAAILDRAPTPPSAWNPDLPPRLTEIISNCLEKDRELRYQSAADLRADLKRLRRDLDSGHNRPIESSGRDVASGARHTPASGTGSVSNPTPMSGGRVASGSDRVAEATPVQVQSRGRGRSAAWIAGATALLALVIAGAWMLRPRETPPPPETGGAVPAQSVSTAAQMTLASATLKAGNYRAALGYAREVLALEPAHAEAARIEREATEALARFDEAIAEARRRMAARDFENAAAALEEARALDASSPSLVELSGRLADAVRQRNARSSSTRAQPADSGSSRSAARNPPAERPRTPPPPAPPTPSQPTTPQVTPPSPVVQPQTPATPTAPAPATAAPPTAPSRPTPPAAVPGTAAAPSEPRAGTPAAATETDESMIRDVIATYGRAIERKDLALFRSIKPNLTRQEERRLEEGFRAVTSQRVTLTVTSLSRDGDRASVVVQRRDVIDAGGRQHTSETQQVLTLSRTGRGWVIVEIR